MSGCKKYFHDINLVGNKLQEVILNPMTTVQRVALGSILGPLDAGYVVYDTDTSLPYFWDGTAWQTAVNSAIWGNITGLITNQTDLITYLSGNYVPLNRNITINGITQDLSVDRTWTISSLPPQAGNAGNYLTTDGTNASWAPIPLPTPAALTKTDDTNVTLTLTGSPSTALLQAVGLQLGWTGTLADSRISSAATWNAKPNAYYQTSSPGAVTDKSFWMSDDTGALYQYVNDGDSAQWVQHTLPIGPQGPQGVNGTNNIDLLTTTPLTGLLKGNGSTVVVTSVLTEIGYTPEDVANKSIDPTFAANSDTLYPSQKAVKTALDNFADDVDYAIMINQKILYNI